MYTSLNKQYPDLLRTWHQKSIQSFSRGSPKKQTNIMKQSISAADVMQTNIATFDTFPPYIDPTEEQELCLDPIRALAIPRSQYHSIKEVVLCRKGITRLESTIQLLKNLDTLILRHNRLRQIAFLIPERNFSNSPSSLGEKEENSILDTLHSAPHGCRLLRYLYLSHNCLQTLDGDIPKLRHLEVLLLAHNSLSNLRVVSAQLKPLRYLRELDLRGNPLCDELNYRLFLIHEHPHIEVLDRRRVQDTEQKEAKALFGVVNKIPSNYTTLERNIISNTVSVPTTPSLEIMGCKKILKSPSHTCTQEAEEEDTNFTEDMSHSGVYFSISHEQEQEQEQRRNICLPCTDKKRIIGGMPKKTVAFFSTFTISSNENDTITTPRQSLFKPSACESLLEQKVRRIERKKLRHAQKELEKREKALNEVKEKHEALHATWAMSRQGMVLSPEKLETVIKTLETLPTVQTTTAAHSSSQRGGPLHRKSPVGRQHGGDQGIKTRSSNEELDVVMDYKLLELPRLPTPTPGHGDHSVLFDALLNRSSVVKAKIGKNSMCLPEGRRLRRMNNLLDCTNELLKQQTTIIDGREKQVTLLRAIQQQKDALIPEPWERLSRNGQGTTLMMTTAERLEYFNMMAISLYLPTELSALEGHFMTNVIDASVVQETQRGRKQHRKDKRRVSEISRTATNSLLSTLDSTNAQQQQRVPSVLSATNVEVGQVERKTFMRVINMLDSESGVWNLSINNIVEAFLKEYPNKEVVTVVEGSTKKDEQQGTTSSRRLQRAVARLRAKSERHLGNIFLQNSDTREISPALTAPVVLKPAILSLSTLLIDMTRYVPFVENRLALFRANCALMASKGEEGSTGESLREYFAKSQLISMHLDRLLEAAKMAGLTRDDTYVRLIPVESIAVQKVHEVGSFFKGRMTP